MSPPEGSYSDAYFLGYSHEDSVAMAEAFEPYSRAGLTGALIGASFSIPGPEDVVVGAAIAKFGANLLRGGRVAADIVETPMQRGVRRQAEILEDMGLPENTRKVIRTRGLPFLMR